MPGVVINPLTDDMNTIRPRASRIFGRTACVTPIWAVTFTSSWRDKSSRDSPSTGPFTMMPALLTTPFNTPGSSSESFAIEALSAMSRESHAHWTTVEATQGGVGSSGGIDLPPSPAHVFGDRQTDSSACAGNQYGSHGQTAFEEMRRCQTRSPATPMVSSAIADTVMGCGRPRCCHDHTRARPPTKMVDSAKVTADDCSTRPS